MSDLILLVYRSRNDAFVAGEALAALQQQARTEPEDIVVVTKDASDRIAVNQSIDLLSGQPLGGGRWGALIGMLFLDARKPVPGGKGLAAQFVDAGLDADFVHGAAQAVRKGGTAVGLHVRLLGPDRVLDRVKALKGDPLVLRARLSAETEDRLHDMQAQIPARVLDQAGADPMAGGGLPGTDGA